MGTILRTRAGCAAASVALGSLLVAAAMLSPDSRGYGTHEQLGLGPCTFATLTGSRCPTCGMTTAWCHLLRGEFAAAVRTHACGSLLAALAAVTTLVGFWLSVFGAERIRHPSARICLVVAAIFLTGLLGEWLIRLALQEWSGHI